jgi:hypothetical protein
VMTSKCPKRIRRAVRKGIFCEIFCTISSIHVHIINYGCL